ncbi:serine carboxypeptidase PepF [Aspergillus heteromorphus CBS 117.55]|uniref:Carboxypeptidase n=1 Tax=Aspergillus heteromorphus CBS 117.55 TaxID=1448321 RepID=A0A317X3M2_9EURO|nr:serine carboxypeptidase PepF [Aspergillus heteromorphus CBS 117.55]PWY91150.1 serine carboxypeptidase PepF [Aspergillus heteromorphus CBS 117.55]
MLFRSLLSTAVVAVSLCADNVSALKPGRFGQKIRDAHDVGKRASNAVKRSESIPVEDYQFLTNKTKPFRVESLPDVHFDLGEMYSGLIPLEKGNLSRSLFFVFQPTINAPVDEITIWLNGGPGCSSLEAFLQENGRFLWQPGTFQPFENPYSWVNLTNVLWVDQPVGTGFSLGTPTATSEEDVAADFVKFFKNWQEVFGIKNYSIYVTGESYAGRYVPYISGAFLDQNDTEHFDLKGALAYDPCIGQFDYVQEEAPVVPFVQNNANLFNFNASFMAELESLHEYCGYKEFIDEYLVFPPSGIQPPKSMNWSDTTCDVFDLVNDAALDPNPCFNPYEISEMCPILWDVLGFPSDISYVPAGATIYFDRPDVKRALHAPNMTWLECSDESVFVGGGGGGGPEQEGDLSANPIERVLPQVIERTNRVLIGNGDYDMVILTNGTLLSIQNMTWNGQLGFQTQPSTPINIDIPDLMYNEAFIENGYDPQGGQGIMGIQHYERGLMWVETFQSGHMEPQYQPRVSYRHLEWLLGRREHI